jgi:hypothetical protein
VIYATKKNVKQKLMLTMIAITPIFTTHIIKQNSKIPTSQPQIIHHTKFNHPAQHNTRNPSSPLSHTICKSKCSNVLFTEKQITNIVYLGGHAVSTMLGQNNGIH